MTQYAFILLNGEQEQALEKIRELGLMDISRSVKPVDEQSRQLAEAVERVDSLLQALKKIKLPEDTRAVPREEGGWEEAIRPAGETIQRYAELQQKQKNLEKEAKALAIWGNYDKKLLRELEEAGVAIHFHELSLKKFKAEWKERFALVEAGRDKSKLYFIVAGEDTLPGAVPAPQEDLAQTREKLQLGLAQLKKLEGEILSLQQCISELEKYREEACSQLELYLAGVSACPAAENSIVTLQGYAPSENDAAICACLDRMNLVYVKEAARGQDNPPVKLRNNWFARQFEVLTDMYGRPAYDEFDPTPILGPFFLLFFAMCMGDAGYGMLLVLIGAFLRKKVPAMATMGPLVMMLGAATFLVGIVLHTFFGINLYEAGWVPQPLKGIMISGSIAGYDAQMVLAVGVGIFHICLAMVVKAICYTHRFGFLKSLSTWGWTLLIVGSILISGLALPGILDKALVKILMIALGIVSGLGIFILNDIHRNPLLNIGAGLWETYNTATGLLGDILSYLRLYALGLAGGMLGSTFNLLAQTTLDLPVPGLNALVFALILMIGHTLNLALSCLGAFVHPLRLTFVEYFKNSGFEGSGRFYRPLK